MKIRIEIESVPRGIFIDGWRAKIYRGDALVVSLSTPHRGVDDILRLVERTIRSLPG